MSSITLVGRSAYSRRSSLTSESWATSETYWKRPSSSRFTNPRPQTTASRLVIEVCELESAALSSGIVQDRRGSLCSSKRTSTCSTEATFCRTNARRASGKPLRSNGRHMRATRCNTPAALERKRSRYSSGSFVLGVRAMLTIDCCHLDWRHRRRTCTANPPSS